jgi:hypothetical protein
MYTRVHKSISDSLGQRAPTPELLKINGSVTGNGIDRLTTVCNVLRYATAGGEVDQLTRSAGTVMSARHFVFRA